MVNKGIHVQYVNIKDNVPFQRVYRSKKMFKSAFGRMKDARFISAIDFNSLQMIKPADLGL